MSNRKKILIAVLCVIAGFVVAASVIAPRVIQIDRYRPDVIAFLERETGRPVQIQHLALSLLPNFAIRVDKFSLGNPPGFPRGDCVAIRRIDALLDFRALLKREIVIRSLTIDQPVLNLSSEPGGRWNCQMARRRPVQLPPGDPPLFRLRDVANLSFDQGEVSIQQLGTSGRPASWPISAGGLSGRFQDVNLVKLNELVSALLHGADVPHGRDGAQTVQGQSGEVNALSLHIGSLQASHLQAHISTLPDQVRLAGIEFRLGGGHVKAGLTVDVGFTQRRFDSAGTISGVSLAKILALFPRTRGKMTGTLDGRWVLSGDFGRGLESNVAELGAGTVTIRKGRWPQLLLSQELMQLVRLAHLGPPSGDFASFSSITADWKLSQGIVRSSDLRVIGSGFSITGGGSMQLAPPRSMHFRGDLQVAAVRNLLTNFLAELSGATFRAGQLHLPFAVNGTVKQPAFRLEKGLSPASRP
jgi:uncharacterized protein involved in outer membrane biogenesis